MVIYRFGAGGGLPIALPVGPVIYVSYITCHTNYETGRIIEERKSAESRDTHTDPVTLRTQLKVGGLCEKASIKVTVVIRGIARL